MFSYDSPCQMSVSIIQSIGTAYTSRVTGKSSIDCYKAYLEYSDQRGAKFHLENNTVVKS